MTLRQSEHTLSFNNRKETADLPREVAALVVASEGRTLSFVSTRCIALIVLALLLVHAALLAWGAWRHSPTFNEPAHLVAGISHWQFGRFELYRVNPPLVRMVAAFPVLAAGAETDWTKFYDSPGARPVFSMGEDFVVANGKRSFWLFTLARWACIPLSLLGGYICFCWARELYGDWAGLLALTLWCFSPNIIGHAQLITPDVGATSLGVCASYLFWRWLRSPSWGRAFVAGLTMGLAELSKMTWIILFGLWPMLWFVWCLSQRGARLSARGWPQRGSQLAIILGIALYVLNLGYGFEGSFQKLGDFQFVSETLRGPTSDSVKANQVPGNRFAESWLGEIPMPVPRNYLLGLDVQRRDFEKFDRPSYLSGEFRDRGWWYYYLYALAIKVPLGTWLLLALAVFQRTVSRERKLLSRDDLVLLAPGATVLILVSSQTGFNHHMRYVLPLLPFVFIWTSQVARAAVSRRWIMPAVLGGSLAWSVGSSVWVYPHSLSYFNELAGGPSRGHAHLINSNIDWGQDLLYLKEWLSEHPEARSLYLAYYGHFDPRVAGIEYTLPPSASSAGSDDSMPARLEPGWYAISVNFLRGYPWRAPDGAGGWQTVEKDAFSFFQSAQPVVRAGYSIYVYHVTADGTTHLHHRTETVP